MPPLELVSAPPRPAPRRPDGHKGTYGRVLVVAGSRGMSGAAVLTGSAALRGGAGLVQVASPADVQPVVAAGNPCYLTAAVPQHADGTYSLSSIDEVLRLAKSADVLAIGPGLGDRPDVGELVRTVLLAAADTPTVLDADGLNVLRPLPAELADRSAPLVLTPHPGEFARLLGVSVADVQADRQRLAAEFAGRWNAVVLLKGTGTVVTDGRRVYVNTTGNPGMATGGTGDVLTGLVAAFLGQGLDGFGAAALGAFVHGRAGDLAAAELGQLALTAADLLDYLPPALNEPEASDRA
jgi:NAD(P)H-hydrate epimerase